MTIRTIENLVDALANDLAWRKREIAALRKLLNPSTLDSTKQTALIRASVALLYAHWEGFVKSAATAYIEFVAMQKLKNSELTNSFLALSFRSVLRKSGASNKLSDHIDALTLITASMNERCNLPVKNAISTEANLSSRVLREIVATLGLDFVPFESKEKLIDEVLLLNRNRIAHGEYIALDLSRTDELFNEVINMIEILRTQIENGALLKQYQR